MARRRRAARVLLDAGVRRAGRYYFTCYVEVTGRGNYAGQPQQMRVDEVDPKIDLVIQGVPDSKERTRIEGKKK